ncbi:MAG: pentapeptide repeat-containing protein [Solirubrobacteraceae bacterium]
MGHQLGHPQLDESDSSLEYVDYPRRSGQLAHDRQLAWTIVGVALLVIALAAIAVVAVIAPTNHRSDWNIVLAVVAPLIALLGTAAGFYFGGSSDISSRAKQRSGKQRPASTAAQYAESLLRAAGQLTAPDVAPRIAAVYALESLGQASSRDTSAVLDILLAHVRGRQRSGNDSPDDPVSADVQAALRVLGRLGIERDPRRTVDLSGLQLDGADLSGAVLKGVNLSGTSLRGADLRSADLRRADLLAADLRGCRAVTADFSQCRLQGAAFDDALVAASNFSEALMTGASLRRCFAAECSFRGALLPEVDAAGAIFTDADFRGALLAGSNIADALVRGALADESTVFPDGYDPTAAGVKLAAPLLGSFVSKSLELDVGD